MDRSIVEEYWTAALVRLRAEVDGFANLVRHNAEKGRENELALARMLSNLVPGYVQVGSGMLIDSTGTYSRQTDLIFFDAQDEPSAFAQTTQLLYPVEVALAAIEVKTNFAVDDLKDIAKKAKAIRELKPVRTAISPLIVLFAYKTSVNFNTMHSFFKDCDEDERPDLICVVTPGVVGGTGDILDTGHTWRTGIAPLTHPSDPGSPVEAKSSGTEELCEGRLYPVVPLPSGPVVLSDPAWALLVFLDHLLAQMASRSGRSLPVFCSYVRSVDREMSWTP